MPHISDILKIEKERMDPSAWNVIHLFREGGFYRAYEWSAWLICVIAYNDEARAATKERRPLSITHKRLKEDEQTYIFVGFPLNSVEKFIPQRSAFTPIDDAQIDITISLPQSTDGSELTYERLSTAYEKWKSEQPVNEPKKKVDAKGAESTRRTQNVTLTGVMADLLAYPLEQHTLMENTQYLSCVKQQLAALI